MKTQSEQLVQERINDLRENTNFVSTLFGSLVGYAIIAADFDGNVLAFNEGARQIYGYAPEEIIGKQSIELFLPNDFIDGGELQRIIDTLTREGRVSCEGERIRQDGERFPAQSLYTTTKDKNGRVVGFIEIVEDLTERKKAEQLREQLQRKQLQLDQLERERAEAMRNYQHYLALSQGEEPETLETLFHPNNEVFLNGLLSEYRDIVLRYIRAIRIREDRPSDCVRQFAQRLAAGRSRARDVVRLHLRVLDEFSQRATPAQERAFSSDARLALVELMGNLLDIYLSVSITKD